MTNKWIMALMMGLAVAACAPKDAEVADEENAEAAAEVAPAEKTAADFVPSKQELDDVSYLVGINFGSFIKGYNFGDLNLAQVKKGMLDFINAKGTMQTPGFDEQFRVNPNQMNELFNNYLEERHNFILYTNKEAGEKFLAANAKKPGVKTTASGLQYEIVAAGSDVKAGPKDTVWVNYKGTLLDGTVFDQTPEGADPVQMTLNRVIPGWTEGLQLIGEGGAIKLYIPANLAYGERGNQGIEPNSTLKFEISLDRVGKIAD